MTSWEGVDPFKLAQVFWPQVYFPRYQRDIVRSVWENDETDVKAANKVGKDFLGGFIAVVFFLTRRPCRVVTTSAKGEHLKVLWSEINWFINNSRVELRWKRKGTWGVDKGPLRVMHQDVRYMFEDDSECPTSYIVGMVASPDRIAAMQGHHAKPDPGEARKVPWWEVDLDRPPVPEWLSGVGEGMPDQTSEPLTLFMCDESSSVPHSYKKMADTWAKREYIFGNSWPCENFFRYAFQGEPGGAPGGDIPRAGGRPGYYRKVFTVRASDSPNVRYGLARKAAGEDPYVDLVPGIKSFEEYEKHREVWNEAQQCVSLDAEFYESKGTRMFPRAWLENAKERARVLGMRRPDRTRRKAEAAGCDPAEGGDDSTWSVIDYLGLLEQFGERTPDTTVVVDTAEHRIMGPSGWGVPEDRVCFDAGGGGHEHADRLRRMGYAGVKTVAFGAAPTAEVKTRTRRGRAEKVREREDRVTYANMRAEMYYTLRLWLDPDSDLCPGGFAIPEEYYELFRQLSAIPLLYDGEGKVRLPPKSRKNPESKELTLKDLLGCSPDEADSLVVALHALCVGEESEVGVLA